MSAQATPVAVTGAGVVMATPATLRGWSLFSTPGDTVTLYDSPNGATGTVLATVVIPAAGAVTFALPDGLRAAKGIYLQCSGALAGSVWIG